MKNLEDFKIKNLDDFNNQRKMAANEPELFWSGIASTFQWNKKWKNTLKYDWSIPNTEWFVEGKLNITENCLDRYAKSNPDKKAIIWEANDPNEDFKVYTYKELLNEVCKFSNGLKKIGVKKGDRICIYMPMIPELTIAVLACARVGAIHSVVFAGFSSVALAARINDSSCSVIITSDGGFRGEKITPLKKICDQALKNCPTIKNCIVYKRTSEKIDWFKNRDIWWDDLISGLPDKCEPTIMNSEDTLFILYTSGSTGKPKGMVHTCGGYMVYTAYTFMNVFQYSQNDVYWCTADIGWITGHSYMVYGPLLVGATSVHFEGVPSYPDWGRFWQVCQKHKVNQFYTAPTAIRSLAKQPIDFVNKYNLSSLSVLGSVGEPINLEAWEWYYKNIGKGKLPIVDTWWQTETGGIMISSIPKVTKQKPTYATKPLPGVNAEIVDNNGNLIEESSAEGILLINFPWPSIARTIYGDHDRYKNVYFSAYKNKYFPGDGALRDENGMYRITGRVDDVVIVSGHNLGTAPIENSINEHPKVVESAVVGYPHEIKGNALMAFIILYDKIDDNESIKKEINDLISNSIGPIAKPEKVIIVSGLPKTRSGKIMRRILRKFANNDMENLGDTSTLLNPEIVNEIKNTLKSLN